MRSRWWIQFSLGLLVCSLLSGSAFAQYPPSGGGSGGAAGTSSAPAPSGGYGNGVAIGASVGAAAAIGLAYLALHKTSVVGCVEQSSDGTKLMNEKDKKTYALVASNAGLPMPTPGERVQLIGKKAKGNGQLAFVVHKLGKNYGSCQQWVPLGPPAPSHNIR